MDKYIDSKALTYYNNKIKEKKKKKKEIPTKTSELINDSDFLSSHQDISGKADKATTLAGYGITDAYTSQEVDQEIENYAEPLMVEIDSSNKRSLGRQLYRTTDTKHFGVSFKVSGENPDPDNNIIEIYSIPQIDDLLTNKSNIESGIIAANNLAWYKYDSNYTLTGSYELIGDICFLYGSAKLVNGWDKVYYSLPIAAAHKSETITSNNEIKYSIATGFIDNTSVLEIKRLDGNLLNTEDIIQFSLTYRYQ